jgi:hypothetical protein
MAIGRGLTRPRARGWFKRPTATTGLVSWLTTVDHKRIGILYFIAAFVFFLSGGIEALIMRLQLATPDGRVVSAEVFNQLFSMHGTTMVFLVIMPLSAALFTEDKGEATASRGTAPTSVAPRLRFPKNGMTVVDKSSRICSKSIPSSGAPAGAGARAYPRMTSVDDPTVRRICLRSLRATPFCRKLRTPRKAYI